MALLLCYLWQRFLCFCWYYYITKKSLCQPFLFVFFKFFFVLYCKRKALFRLMNNAYTLVPSGNSNWQIYLQPNILDISIYSSCENFPTFNLLENVCWLIPMRLPNSVWVIPAISHAAFIFCCIVIFIAPYLYLLYMSPRFPASTT